MWHLHALHRTTANTSSVPSRRFGGLDVNLQGLSLPADAHPSSAAHTRVVIMPSCDIVLAYTPHCSFARRAPRRPDFTGKHRSDENSPTYRAKTMHLIGHVRSRLPDMCRDLACPWPSAVLPPARWASAPLSLDFELGLPWDVIESAVQCSIAVASKCAEGPVPAEHSVRLGVRCAQLELIRHSLLCPFAGTSVIFSAAMSLEEANRKGQAIG